MSRLPTLLVVDDEVRSLETLQRILEDDFDVKTAATNKDLETEVRAGRFREDLFYRLAVQHIVRSFDPCMVCTVH